MRCRWQAKFAALAKSVAMRSVMALTCVESRVDRWRNKMQGVAAMA